MPARTDPKVLIVDDQPRNLDALEAMLSPLPCAFVRALSAEEALLHLLHDDFAAIVLDIRMPGMSGIELATLIKQRRRSQHIPILFLTAHLDDEGDVLRGYHVGAVDYLSKPVNPAVLRSKVGVFVDLFRTARALADVNAALQLEVAERQRAQAALQEANAELERRVEERAAALVEAHEGVRESEQRLRLAIEVAQSAVWEWNLHTGEVTWSSEPEALFGFPADAFGPERRIVRAVHPEDRARAADAIERALASGHYEGEFRIVRPDGSVAWITERGRVIHDADGRAWRMVGVAREVTVEREAAREREALLRSTREARDEAERQIRLKDEFLATLSHELRTPMNAILGWLSILQSGKAVRDRAAALAVVHRNAQIQARLIDDLLDMTRLMSGNVHLELAPVDLAALVHATQLALQPLAEAKQVVLTSGANEGLPALLGDARRLQQVLSNVANNAVKFTPPGGRVDIRATSAGNALRLVVTDSGRGISPAFLPHVFERFRQEDPSATRETFGLGLGLSIAKHLVELHGGTIQAFSEGEGRGATFMVQLPLAPVGQLVADAERAVASRSSSLHR